MPRRKRLSRKEPARTAPIRKFSTLLRSNDERTVRSEAGKSQSSEDAIAQAVRMGYSVVEEQIRRGRQAAQQTSGSTGAFGALPTDANAMVGRLFRYTTDLAALCFDMMGMLTQSSVPGMPVGKSASPAATAAARKGSEPSTRVVIEITSKRRNKVTLDLWSRAAADDLAIPGLHSVDSEKAPLTNVKFVRGASGEPPRLLIVVPDSQPADVYSGLIVNKETKASAGTLSLRLYD